MINSDRLLRTAGALVTAMVVSIVTAPIAAHAQGATLSPQDRALYARLIAMADTRRLDTATVDQALASTSVPLAAFAALSVGQLGPAEARPRVDLLRWLLADTRVPVAANAAYSLGLLRDTAGVTALLAVVRGDQPGAADAAWALGVIGEPARAGIVELLATDTLSLPVQVQLLLAAARLRPVPVEAVVRHLRSGDGSVAWAAAYAIARTRAAGGMPGLIAASSFPLATVRMSDVDAPPLPAGARTSYYDLGNTAPARFRAEIARALARPAVGDSLADTAFAILTRLASDEHPHVRINALRTLATYGARADAPLHQGARDRDMNVSIAALQSLAAAEGVTGQWLSLWSRDTTFTWRRYVLEAAVAHGGYRPAVNEWTASPEWRERAAVAIAAAAARDHMLGVATALPLVRDPDPRVRAAALGALASDTARISDTVRVLLRTALGDRDEAVRATAISGLGRSPHSDDLPLVLAVLEGSADDRESDARVGAIAYLTATWRRDSTAFAPELQARLTALAPSRDPVARAAAAGLPPLASWAGARIEPRPAGWYRQVVDRVVVPSLGGRPAVAVIHTSRGAITLELLGADAPLTVNNFATLARERYYNGVEFHRIVPNFVVQDGDPRGDGNGGPGYSIRDELNPRRYERGTLGMALSGPDTGGSQYFITHSPQPHLDGGYTVFGFVTAGHSALDALLQGDRVVRIDIR